VRRSRIQENRRSEALSGSTCENLHTYHLTSVK
jgi:hypothetical protein